jgi:hypothetical protein
VNARAIYVNRRRRTAANRKGNFKQSLYIFFNVIPIAHESFAKQEIVVSGSLGINCHKFVYFFVQIEKVCEKVH